MKKRRQKAQRKQYIKDKAQNSENPKLDYVEISMSPEQLEIEAHKHTTWQKLVKDDPANEYNEVEQRMLQEEKIRKIFQTASQVLTEIQFKIFVMRYAYDLKQREIAKQLKCHQSYIPEVLKASVKKIQKRLKTEGIL